MSVKLEPPTPDWKSSLRYLAQTPRKVELNFFFDPIRPREPSFRKDSTSRKDGKDKENPSDGEFNCKTEDVSPKKKKDKKEQRPILGNKSNRAATANVPSASSASTHRPPVSPISKRNRVKCSRKYKPDVRGKEPVSATSSSEFRVLPLVQPAVEIASIHHRRAEVTTRTHTRWV